MAESAASMNSDLLARLTQAQPEERPWLLTEAVLESLSAELRQAVWAVAVVHWFDVNIVAALCPAVAERAAAVYEELQRLSFVEPFGERGHNIHEATRQLLLDRLWHTRPEEFRAISARAAAYFEADKANSSEHLYHQAVTGSINDLDRVMTPLDHNYRRSESEAILQALGEQIAAERVDASVAAETAYWSGRVHQRFYESKAALARYETAIAIYREVGARLGEANTLKAIGDVLQFLDQRQDALQRYETAIAIYREVGDRLGEANTLKAIGDVLQFLDQRQDALQRYETAIAIYREVGARLGEANVCDALALACVAQKDYDSALRFHQQALHIFQSIQSLYDEGWSWLYIARVKVNLGQLTDAQQSYQSAQNLFASINMDNLVALCQQEINSSPPP
jgi:tetratricopeptide (TPR) repeat protein